MPRTYAPINPAVLQWARQESRLTQLEVAKKLNNMNPTRVAEWEEGVSRPTIVQLRKLATLYSRTPAFFFRPDIPESDVPSLPDYRSSADQVSQSFFLRRQLQKCIERRSLFLELTDPSRDWAFPMLLNLTPDDAAVRVRRLLNVSIIDQRTTRTVHEMLRLWIHALEKQEVLIFQSSDFPIKEARGISFFFSVFPIILLNGKDAPAGRIFTLFHELGHLARRGSGLCTSGSLKREEEWCDEFAGALLMPTEAFGDAIRTKVDMKGLNSLARCLKVSNLAMAVRLRSLNLLDQAIVDEVKQETDRAVEAKAKSPVGQVPFYRLRLRDIGRRYAKTVFDAHNRDEVTLADASYMIGAKIQHFPRMEEELGMWPGPSE